MYTEDAAIAALSEKTNDNNKDLGSEEDNEPRVVMPDKVQNKAKVPEKKKAVEIPKNNLLESDVDLSAITPDGKNPEKTVIKTNEKKPAPQK